ncbi:phosphoribosylamine--glycine ligase [Camelliibacillus cellulosilyticus]|uniref:Phosphoribosylamine--glycine ligase n=1 Tax=Camelliibacillus cellulosilyticus TaxID=2174486 RepID=A0ABV9GNV9_9BACL
MKVLVIGRGGREHALVWKLAQSPKVDEVFAAPGNDGMAEIATCVKIEESAFDELIDFVKSEAIDLTVVGPEAPLVDGIVDHFNAAGLKVFGPDRQAAQIEGSKAFSKALLEKYQIPTAGHRVFHDYQAAVDYVKKVGAPIVIKADGLAAGKGVVVALDESSALAALGDMMSDHRFGDAGSTVVMEEFLQGEEYSLMAFVDGERVYPLALAQDHKRAFEGDQGPNTGGMGAYSPVPQLPDDVLEVSMERIMKPVARALVLEGTPYKGVLYAGLMLTTDGPKVIEFNCRFGDPETQVVLPRLTSDLFEAMWALVNGGAPQLEWSPDAVCGVVLAAKGYPGPYEKGAELPGVDHVDNDALVFHAGTKRVDGKWTTNGGRVLLIARQAADLSEAINKVNKDMATVNTDATFYRRDIGVRASR